MRFNILLLLLGLINTIEYIHEDAIKYAKTWFNSVNPKYGRYKQEQVEQVNFVSQCLFNAGQSFSGCKGKDYYGMLGSQNALKDCLERKGWTETKERNEHCKPWYPIFIKVSNNPMILIGFDGNNVKYCGRNPDTCDGEIEQDKCYFYYLE